MKQISLLLTLILLLLTCTECKNKPATVQQSEPKVSPTLISDEETTLFLFSSEKLPQAVDLSQDISRFSFQELRLLLNYVYATHGLYFMEADLYAYFTTNTDWYEALTYELWEKDEDNFPLAHKDITLSAEEQSFVDKINKRLKELQADNFTMRGGERLGNVENIVNMFQFLDCDSLFMDKLARNNFVITSGSNLQLFHVYEENDYRQIPNFITTDLFLQAFHMYFLYALKTLEEYEFIPTLSQLCLGLYNECMQMAATESDPQLKSLAEYNATFYAIPYFFLAKENLKIPATYQNAYQTEIENINEQADQSSAFLSFTEAEFPYSLFKPRGHYTRKPQMEAYFKAMMWLQTAPFCREKEEQLKQATFSAVLLNTVRTEDNKRLFDLYSAVYEPIVFLVGLPDNLSVMDIAAFLEQEKVNSPKAALADENMAKVNHMLLELTKARNQIKPKIEISCPDKINFMPQRYLIDNDVIQNLVDVTPDSKRAYPKGLDVFAALGSQPADHLLSGFHQEKENWSKYPAEMQKMKDKFRNYSGWNSSVYNKWIESLLTLQKPDKTYPEFMQTKAWELKNLNTSLASWSELKHDAILYGEQPMAAECGGGGPPVPVVKGYVEPNLQFWNKLSDLVSLTQNLLEKHGLLTSPLKGKTEQLAEYINFLIQVSKKELAGEVLDENEYYTIEYMGSSIEYFTLSVIDPELYLDNWTQVQGPDKSIAVVADIYTRNVPGCEKNGILHVATGNANNIYVVVEVGGYLYLTRGATFSYYEFVQPPGTRLTDEEWQQMLEEKKEPAIPAWMKDIIIEKEPKVDERMFYSSGC
ncbi:hypothetical protein M2459_001752 [Parabacteroides sp. PF5-5]|uniref:DUF3160 domain-containing protein n=1 Tax=unclassified Parabacteroides TaxID=2649774 RepID=UPI002476DE1F|nr:MULTISPECIES: DUF3160 domain-containing protein [unclassified Parabacteroides]MDH6305015.1 hypothetical protein [Parabacteroides sp. PH5-39]MDH6315900.1 hypothetical protein [Parabacteroides sp. PF5-13]MDH6319557.1 hypothetical protein [Parabacteroides sp. PH5-13]MDH6323288.1 hypothetical protein [Parabacteroides sp. PH5-8]MDH6327204.1 hypothetical protein [Parabacteroides sp. PH5-41]